MASPGQLRARPVLTQQIRRRRTMVVLGAVLVIAAIIVFVQTQREPVIVMTRNVYLGADITRPVRAVEGLTGEKALLALGHANQELSLVLARTDFRTRSRLLAAEIETAQPDLVGLQEVARWRHGPLELDRVGQPNATEVDQDFLALLLSDLSDRGVGYDVVHDQPESDVEAPAFSGNPLTGTAASARDVRLTLSDVILIRRDSDARIKASGGGNYEQRLVLDLAGAPFSFTRGYAWADVSVGSRNLRFVTTHLESQGSAVAQAQAAELLANPVLAVDRPVVLVCDCNSDPADTAAPPGDSVPGSAAYTTLSGGGFEDLWLEQPDSAGPGFTFGLGELVTDATVDGFTRRLDLVLARPGEGNVSVGDVRVTGSALADRDPATGPVALRPCRSGGGAADPLTRVHPSSPARTLGFVLDALSPQRRRMVLAVGALALILVLVLAVTLVVRGRSEAADPVPQDIGGPVLLVPGYGGNGDSLVPLAAALRNAGRTAVIVPEVGDGTGDLQVQAEQLAKVAAQAIEDSGAPSVDVIGYSAGGVVARLWVRDEGGGSLARRVFTLGSPQHGTSQAALGLEVAGSCPAACEQLVPDSDLLRRLNAGDETPTGPVWITLRSTSDEVVTPVDSAALDGALNLLIQDACPDSTAGHGALPTDPVTLAALSTVLASAPPVTPTEVAC